jgi:hypothetical protein
MHGHPVARLVDQGVEVDLGGIGCRAVVEASESTRACSAGTGCSDTTTSTSSLGALLSTV